METAMVGVAATILGALVGAWITYRFSLDLAKRQVFNLASFRFRSAFTEELTKLATTSDDPYDILNRAEAKHIAAGFEFRWVLTEEERMRFDSAWLEYHCADQDAGLPHLEKYSTHLTDEQSGIPKDERRRAAGDRIEALVKLAEPK